MNEWLRILPCELVFIVRNTLQVLSHFNSGVHFDIKALSLHFSGAQKLLDTIERDSSKKVKSGKHYCKMNLKKNLTVSELLFQLCSLFYVVRFNVRCTVNLPSCL